MRPSRSFVSGLCLLASVSSLASVAHAQGAPPARAAAPSGAAHFAGLDLTESQQSSLRELTLRTRAQTHAIIQRQTAGAAPSEADRTQLKEIAIAHHEAFRALLKEPQRRRLDDNTRVGEAARAAEQERLDRERARMRRTTPTGRTPE